MESSTVDDSAEATDLVTLSWCVGEIRDAMSRCDDLLARQLQADGDDLSMLRAAKASLHQAYGALSMVDLRGPDMVAQEAEQLLDAIDAGSTALNGEVASRLSRAFAAVGEYLDDILRGGRAQPLYLFPYYRDLLEARGAERVHPADLFFPPDARLQSAGASAAVLDGAARKALRSKFELGLLKLLRGGDTGESLDQLGAAVAGIRDSDAAASNPTFWHVLATFFEAVRVGAVELDVYAKRLLARLNLQLRRTLDEGAPVADRLLRDVLFSLARAREVSDRLSPVFDAFSLHGAVPPDFEQPRYGRFDVHALAKAAEAVARAKKAWEPVVAGGLAERSDLASAFGTLCEVGDVLSRPGVSMLADTWMAVGKRAANAEGALADSLAIEVATSLLFAEQLFDRGLRDDPDADNRAAEMSQRLQAAMSPDAQLAEPPQWLRELSAQAHERATLAAFVAEAQADLREVESGLDSFFRDHGVRSGLAAAASRLQEVSGVLRLLGHEQAAVAAAATARRVATMQAEPTSPVAEDCDLVAANVGALWYFVEGIATPGGQPAGSARFSFDAVSGRFSADLSPARPAAARELQLDAPAGSTESVLVEHLGAMDAALRSYRESAAAGVPEALPGLLRRVRDDAALTDDAELARSASAAIARLGSAPVPSAQELAALLGRPADLLAGDGPAAGPIEPAVDSGDADDDELIEIFLAEAQEVLDAIDAQRSRLATAPSDVDVQTTIRRGFHTLKGSSRMVGLGAFGEAAWALEQVMNLWLAEGRAATDDLHGLVGAASERFRQWVADLHADRNARTDGSGLIAQADRVRDGLPFESAAAVVEPSTLPPELAESTSPSALGAEQLVAEAAPDPGISVASISDEPPVAIADAVDGAFVVGEMIDAEAIDAEAIDAQAVDAEAIDAQAVDAEAVDAQAVDAQAVDAQAVDAEALDAEAEIPAALAPGGLVFPAVAVEWALQADDETREPIGEAHDGEPVVLTDAIEFPDLAEAPAPAVLEPASGDRPSVVDRASASHLAEAVDTTASGEQVGAEERIEAAHADGAWQPHAEPHYDDVPLLVEALTQVEEPDSESSGAGPDGDGEVDIDGRRISAPLYRIFLSEAADILSVLTDDLADWRAQPDRAGTEHARRALHSLKGSSAIVGLDGVRALAGALERFVLRQRAAGAPMRAADLEEYASLFDVLRVALADFAAGREPAPDEAMLAAANALADRWDAIATSAVPAGDRAEAHDLEGAPAEPERGEGTSADVSDATLQIGAQADETLDAELLPIFVEEAQDYLPQIDRNLRDWLARPDDRALAQLLMRQLHTVKGSARMAGAMSLGQLVHEMETRVEAAIALSQVPVGLIEELIANHDVAIEMFERVRDPGAGVAPAEVTAAPVPVLPAAPLAPSDRAQAEAVEHGARSSPVAPAENGEPAQSMVRVRADRLDALVNESGEVSIARSRLENSLGSVRQSLLDLTENVARLRGQLREIEIQAETQIQTRIAQAREAHEQFDPLEFDRFTRFQELTRMLAESVNDVATVQQNATRSLDDASQDLSGQGQVLRALQQNLMRIRMLRFGTLGDRLYRVVRQSAKQLGKRVVLDIRGSAVEMDRSVLERITAPLEHLLRNAVAHGVEPPEARATAGKPETGEIRVDVRQEGNEVVLELRDDGAGLNLERIRARAVDAGLLGADEAVSPEGLAEMIFRPGFSTAAVVDEISGRGVGMDVVRSEVTALGGRVDVSSAPGQGSSFTIRLPLTLAIAQVVMVTAGSLRFAIPSSSIEQVLQLKPQALAAAYEARAIDWLGGSVPLYYFGALVDAREQRPVAQHYSPIIVARAGGRRIAVHVDSVSRNQEVVIKNVGPQVARVRGVGGATVLGNGEIVLILNLGALAQSLSASDQEASMRAGIEARLAEAPPTVMVVDDSLTVRKVTQRLLVREGYEVMLAKDGVDALRQLQDRLPDAMLVDIEMPRMDGFDLTRHVRADARLRTIPIVMITSRTADKHRNYALSLGVDAFLGKPYAEAELVGHLQRLVTRRTVPAAGVVPRAR